MYVPGRQSQDSVSWRPAAEPPPLGRGDIHLWRIRADGMESDLQPDPLADLTACLDLLGERQRARADRMLFAPHRERYIRVQAGLRRILGLYLDRPPKTLAFCHGQAGKPALDPAHRLPTGLSLEFNLTTSGGLALIAVSLGSELGVDCERIRRRRDLPGIARRMFDPVQAEALATLPEPERLETFYRAWTALEADAKADGRGLFRPRAPHSPPPQVLHCVPAPGYVAAIARERLPPVETWRTLELSAR